MGLLPASLVALDSSGQPREPAQWFRRVDARSAEGRLRSETDWDAIICANVEALSEALRAADVLPINSTLRVLGRQVESVDVLFAEVPRFDRSAAPEAYADEWGEPKRLVLLEDKLVRNPEAKRQVLAQVLDYAQQAQSKWTTDFLCSLSALSASDAWLRRYSSRLDVMLAEGDLLLIIAGDDIDEDLLRLARRFSGSNDPLSLNELCLVSMALYARGEERILVPHVVSSVERHQRQVTIRVRVQDANGTSLRAQIERDVDADVDAARGGALPLNPDVEAFLRRAKSILDSQFLTPASPYEGTAEVRKILEYWANSEDGSRVRFKIHFGGFARDTWSPIEVGLYVESKLSRDQWHRRIEHEVSRGRLPVGTTIKVAGKQTISALKQYGWSAPADLSEALLRDITEALLQFEAVLGLRRSSESH